MNNLVTIIENKIKQSDKRKIYIYKNLGLTLEDIDMIYLMTEDLNKDIFITDMKTIVKNLYNEEILIIK